MPEPLRKRRAVRKGTRNCWECKRRKVRCKFASQASLACENCIHRHTTCVSQEYEQDEDLNVEIPAIGLEARLTKVEGLLQQVLDQSRQRSPINQARVENAPVYAHNPSCETSLFPTNSFQITPSSTSQSELESPITPASEHTSISQSLLAIWPNQYELEYIYGLPAHLSPNQPLRPSTSAVDASSVSVRAMLQLPLLELHPVLIAHRMLKLAGLLQGALSTYDLPAQRRERFEQLESNIADTVAKLVTTNDELTSSIEGIECIAMEALMQNHAGKLHQAWRTLRRATTKAQTLGLYRNMSLPRHYFLDPQNYLNFDVEYLCFKIVCMDCYLSMTLGLPHADHLPYAIVPQQLSSFKPIDQMARLQCQIAERLIERARHDSSEDHDIDLLLLEATAHMPHSWWLVPEPSQRHDIEPDHDSILTRFTYQISHYHLLLRLYLPYVLQPLDGAGVARGKRMAWTASRAILSRFLAFRKWNSSRYYCRGMDFLALVALTVLCVAHIDSRRMGAASTDTLSELAHSYATDRGMMQQTLRIMQWVDSDELALNLARMMQSLLDVEADAADGTEYSATAMHSHVGATEYQSELLDEGRKLQLRIPYFGTIMLQREPGSAQNDVATAPDGFTFEAEFDCGIDWSQQAAACDDWTLQNVNQALFLDLFGTT
ncbi:hypothetical protein C7974DRAFT_65679 [Boeremia exigua]|uniref:uncharacterized protein n=1 Tax=Boeremia exigua TaxID=749465 RepID=UPI001E8DFD4A|nr:uncharacterized protein C7974DRAFT_65679 [Boeremia exigua]KAH6613849.1 hypothetical protein C7974DRAFT_65679 [Boeremia exigua]